jgi:hypothetical protein
MCLEVRLGRVTMATDSSDPHPDAALARDMMSLNTLLARPLSGTVLDKWKGSAKNLSVFKGTVFGSIRWLKTMDPLLTPKHADAFKIRLTHTETKLSYDYEGGAHWITLVALDLPPSKWDGPDDDEYYRVSFVTSGLVAQRIYSLDVSFTAQARWESRNPLMRRVYSIEPLGREFSVDDISFLDPFEVKHRIVASEAGRMP